MATIILGAVGTAIGSGFGGSVSAMRLTEKGYKVIVVEAGRRWVRTSAKAGAACLLETSSREPFEIALPYSIPSRGLCRAIRTGVRVIRILF